MPVAEGDDKYPQYPGIFTESEVLLLNKVDLPAGGHVELDAERAKGDARSLNKSLDIFPISARTGKGMANWYHWLGKSVRPDAPQQ